MKKVIEEVKETRLDVLKKEYNEIYELNCVNGNEKITAYFKSPSIQTLEYYFDNYFKKIVVKEENPDFDYEKPESPDNQFMIEYYNVSNKARNKALRKLWTDCYVESNVDLMSDEYNDIFEIHKYTMNQLVKVHKAELVDYKDMPEEYTDSSIPSLFYIKLTHNETNKFYYAGFKRLSAGLSDMMYDLHDRGKYFASDKMLAEKGFYIGDDEMINFNKYPDFFISYRGLLSNMIRSWSIEFEKKK